MAVVAVVFERRASVMCGRNLCPGSKQTWVAGFAGVDRTAADGGALGPTAAVLEASRKAASNRFAVREVG